MLQEIFAPSTYNQGQRPAALGIDEEQRGNGEDNLDGTIAQTGIQRLVSGVTHVGEDASAVERDDVDTAHLLSKHDSRGTVVRAPNAWHGEAVLEAGKVASATRHLQLLLVHDVRVVVVTRGDDGMRSELDHGLETFWDLARFHQPARRLGAEINADH
jgi:hypothetical protein